MKRTVGAAAPIALLGLLLAAVPEWIFPVCGVHEGAAPMKCHWTGRIVTGFGAAFFLTGVLLFVCRDSGVRAGVSIMAVLMSVLAALTPSYLIGVCASPVMPCHMGTYPAIMVTLALVALCGTFNTAFLWTGFTRERSGNEATHDIPHSAE